MTSNKLLGTVAALAISTLGAGTAQAQGPLDWAGLYVGGQVGAMEGISDWTFPVAGTATENFPAGGFGGIYVGYNWATQNTVYGIELQFNAASVDGSESCPNPAFNCTTDVKSLAVLNARIGKPVGNKALVYGTIGVASAKADFATPLVATGVPFGTDSATFSGLSVGIGYEAMLQNDWAWRTELSYIDLGTKQLAAGLAGSVTDMAMYYGTLTVGLTKHF